MASKPKVNVLSLAGITRNLAKNARQMVVAQYTPQFQDLARQRQVASLAGAQAETRARSYGQALSDQYGQTLKDVEATPEVHNPLAAGGQGVVAPQIDNWKGYLAALQGSSGMGGGEQAAQIGIATNKTLGDLGAKRTQLLSQRGADVVKTQQDMRQQAFTNYATIQGLGIQHDKLAQALAVADANQQYKYDALGQAGDIANRNADLSQQRINATLRGQDIAHQDRLRRLAAQRGGWKNMTPAQQHALKAANSKIRASILTGVNDIVPFLRSYVDPKSKKTPYKDTDGTPNWKAIRLALNKRLGNDGDIVNAVVNMYVNKGKLDPKYVAALHSRGIGIPDSWLKPNANDVGLG